MRARPSSSGAADLAMPDRFETSKQLVHGLLAHPGAVGEHAGTDSIRTRKLKHRRMRHAQLREAGGVELVDDPT
jgi:hypothetical protein